jgi:hypothetical protein
MDEDEEQPIRADGGRRDVRRTERLTPSGSDRSPVNPGWRSDRTTRPSARRAPRGFAASPQEAVIWLQAGGWRYVAAAAGALVLLLVLLLLFRDRGEGTGITPLATRVPTEAVGAGSETSGAGASGLPELQPTVTPAPLPSPTPPATNFVVTGTNGEGLFLRADHSTDAQILETLPDGTAVTRAGEDFSAADRVWRRVRAPSGTEGWVAAEFLQGAP